MQEDVNALKRQIAILEKRLQRAEHARQQTEQLKEQADRLYRNILQDLETTRSQVIDLVESSPIPFFLLDADGDVLRLNNRACDFTFNRKPTHISELFAHTADALRLMTLLRQEGICEDYEWEYTHPLGARFFFRGFARSLATPDGLRFMLWCIDNTHAKLQERALIATSRQADAANNAKSMFLANMSHEIRTPLTSIIGFADLALDPETNSNEKRLALEKIKNNGSHLLHIINDILDLSKIESGQLEFENEDIDLFELLRGIADTIEAQARAKVLPFTIDYHFPLPQWVHTDGTRLRQVLFNLLSNAVKSTQKGEVRLTVSWLAKAKALHFSIRDTGEGISEADQRRLFQPFVQADAGVARRFGGTGLGLAICRFLVEKMGGSIELQSQVGQGSEFSFALPLDARSWVEREPQRKSQPEHKKALPQYHGKRVLMAEDNEDIQQLIWLWLKGSGVQLELANNGQEAVELALQHDYDLILMDMQMPIMGGLEAIEVLMASGCDIPIVAMTANVQTHEVANYRQQGCADVLPKPIELKNFFRVLSRFLKRDSENFQHVAEQLARSDEMKQLRYQHLEEWPNVMQQIYLYLSRSDFDNLRKIAHAQKGAAGSLGFSGLASISSQLEIAAKGKDAPLCQQLLGQLMQSLKVTE